MENTRSLGRILPTALLAGHCATTARLRTTQPTAPTSRPLTPWTLASTLFATDADVKQAVTSWLQTTDTDLPTPGYTPWCQGETNSYVDVDHVEVRYVLSATQVPCVRYVISETALYKLQYPHEQQAKLQELNFVQSWCSVIYITVSQVHIIWIKHWSV